MSLSALEHDGYMRAAATMALQTEIDTVPLNAKIGYVAMHAADEPGSYYGTVDYSTNFYEEAPGHASWRRIRTRIRPTGKVGWKTDLDWYSELVGS